MKQTGYMFTELFLEKIFRKIMTFEDRTRIEEEESNFH